jgi:2-oxoglutarate ferredoxin oxidoreductase subunit delta
MKKNTKVVQEPDAAPKKKKKPKDRERTEIRLLKERCKGCGYCVEFCPKNVLEMSEEINTKGFLLPRVARPEDCIVCEICQYVCPDMAVFVHREPKSDDEESS